MCAPVWCPECGACVHLSGVLGVGHVCTCLVSWVWGMCAPVWCPECGACVHLSGVLGVGHVCTSLVS